MPYHIKKTGNSLDPNKVMYYKEAERWSDVYSERQLFGTRALAQQIIDAERVGVNLRFRTATIVEEE